MELRPEQDPSHFFPKLSTNETEISPQISLECRRCKTSRIPQQKFPSRYNKKSWYALTATDKLVLIVLTWNLPQARDTQIWIYSHCGELFSWIMITHIMSRVHRVRFVQNTQLEIIIQVSHVRSVSSNTDMRIPLGRIILFSRDAEAHCRLLLELTPELGSHALFLEPPSSWPSPSQPRAAFLHQFRIDFPLMRISSDFPPRPVWNFSTLTHP